MRPVRLLAALALTAAAALGGSAAHAAPVPAGLTVTLLDIDGDPVVGLIQLIGEDGYPMASALGGSSKTFDLEPGEYGVMGVTAWGGLQCAGLNACDYVALSTGQARPDGSIVVAPGGTATATVQPADEAATIGGKRVVGSELSIDYAAGLTEFYRAIGVGGGASLAPSVTWLRNGSPIPGATEPTYVTRSADTGKTIAARLEYEGIGLAYLSQVMGIPAAEPFTTAAVTVTKRPAATFIRMIRSEITSKQRGVVRVDVTSPNSIVTGKVTVTVGRWSDTRPLRNGRVAFRLPTLQPGRYAVHAAYLGSTTYLPSEAKPKKLTVTKAG